MTPDGEEIEQNTMIMMAKDAILCNDPDTLRLLADSLENPCPDPVVEALNKAEEIIKNLKEERRCGGLSYAGLQKALSMFLRDINIYNDVNIDPIVPEDDYFGPWDM